MNIDSQVSPIQNENQAQGEENKTEELDEFTIISAGIDGVNHIDYKDIVAKLRSSERNAMGQVIIEDKKMKAYLIALAHSGLSGHRGIEHTTKRLMDRFYWPGIKDHVETFVKRCLHCLSCRAAKVKCLLAEQMHASERNLVLHYDFLYVFKKYVLVIKDDFSHYVELSVWDSADHFAVVEALLQWNARFGLRRGSVHVSDRGTHFKNNVCHELERMLGIDHRFTLAQTHYSNGTVEVVNRHILKILRTLRSEFKVKDWESLIPAVQACLNLNKSPSLGDLSPTEVFTGLPVDDPVSVLFDRAADILHVCNPPDLIARRTNELRLALERMHKDVDHIQRRHRNSRRKNRNRKRSLPNYSIGDFVLVHIEKPRSKPAARFDGPYRVTGTVSDHVYIVEHLLSQVRKHVHVERLQFFSVKDNVHLQRIKEHVLFHKSDTYEVDKVLDIRVIDGVEEVRVKWLGFEESEATWEPADVIEEDLPEEVARLRNQN